MFTFNGLNTYLDYNKRQSAGVFFWNFFLIGENNINSKDNFYKK